MSNKFVHLHLHTTYSFLDGANKISDCIKRVKELNMDTVAITDHNHIGGWLDFKQACEDNNIKPIYGCEMYQTWNTNILSLTADDRRQLAINTYTVDTGLTIPEKVNGKKITKKQVDEIIKDYIYDTKQYHLILLAMNQTGLNNLIKLQSEAADKCTYNGRFCCDFEMLREYNEGLICLSACLGGMIPSAIKHGDINKARELIEEYQSIFGDRFYLEIQPLAVNEQKLVNRQIIDLANQYGIKYVATNDVHYTLESDADDHDTLLCVGIGKMKNDPDRMRYENEFWIRSYDEMRNAFQRHIALTEEEIDTALNNTLLIANRIEDNLSMGSKTPLFPKVEIPEGLTAEQYLINKSYKGLYKYYKENSDIDIIKYEKRLAEELDIINTKGFAPYILKIIENVEYCESVDIPIGPGRGSAAGALTLFVNGITKVIDPIKYELLFFRFLTKDRKDPPDVDMDYAYYGRDKLISHLEEQHGQECVSHIGTITVMGVKSGLKDFGRVLGLPFEESNNISKEIDIITDKAPGIKFKDLDGLLDDANDCINTNEQLYNSLIAKYNKFKTLENRYPELFRLARKFEGTPRNMGVHASGVLVMPCNVTDYFPTRTVDGIRVALFTGPQLESLGAIKLDILGLKTLDVLDKTIKAVDPNLKVNDLYKEIQNHLDDGELFHMVQQKETEGLFQMESNLFKSIIGDILPTDIKDLCAILAIGRPGPLSAGMHTQYANRKNGFEIAIPQLRGTDEITESTYHTIIYQEQIMLIAKKIAKFNDAQTDSLCRKPLAKKKKDLMEIFRKCFIFGKVNSELPEDYDETDINQPYYDTKGKYGDPILGGIHCGYTIEELEDFYEKLKGYASYLFNKSHSATYAVITLCTMFLKIKYPAKFLAALLSMQTEEEKINTYSKVASDLGIKINTPDINKSEVDFIEDNNTILYGFKSIKGLGQASIDKILEFRPFNSLQDCIDKMTKKYANKRVLVGLISSGAFDSFNSNRYELLNEMMDIRKDKDDRYTPDMYDIESCVALEKKFLGTSLSYDEWWNTILDGDNFEQTFSLIDVTEKLDKKNNMMAFATLSIQGTEIKTLIFSSIYNKTKFSWDSNVVDKITIQGKRSGNNIIVNSVIDVITKNDYEENIC
jgi:DNA polymerase-3 subunit alpha